MASTAIDEVRGRSHDQLQRDEPHSRDGDHGGGELDGGLARKGVGLPSVEGGGRNGGQVGGLGLKKVRSKRHCTRQ